MVILVVRPRRYALTAALCVALCGLSLRSQVGSAQVQSVTVTGRGATRYDAREDAIRQALQQTVQQLVTVDRVIENEKIALDKIASTMNGYVTKFDEQRVTTTADGRVSMEAIVEVSPTRIQNFLSSTSGTRVQTGDAVADAQRELLARRARVEVLAGLFSPFPSGALILSKHAISPHAERPEFLQLVTTVQVAPPFIERLKAGMRSLGARQVSGPHLNEFERPNTFTLCFEEDGQDEVREARVDLGRLPSQFSSRGAVADCLTLTPVDVPLLNQMLYGMKEYSSFSFGSHSVLDLIVGIETPEGVQRIEALSTTVRPRIFDRDQGDPAEGGRWMLFNISKARHTVGVLIPLVTLANSPAGTTVVSFPVVVDQSHVAIGRESRLLRSPEIVMRSILRGGIEGPPISKEFINGLARSFR